jgi:dolichol-phosphate mannosyltransferase
MPAYNEEGAIRAALVEVQEQVLDNVPGANLIVVNDGSKDKTASILDEIAQNDDRILVIHQDNKGHGPSLVRALNQARGDYVFQIDSDMQIPLLCFSELWKLTDTQDAVFGIRSNRQDPPHRLILSALITFVLGKMFQIELPDPNAPFKIIRREIWEDMYRELDNEKLVAPSIYLAIYAKKHHYKVVDVSVPHRARTKGTASLNLVSLARFCFSGMRQVIQYKKRLL